MHHSTSRIRSTLGEALIVVTVTAGLFWNFSQNRIVPQDLWLYAALLCGLVLFYFALLFARMLFFWMTGGDQCYDFSPHGQEWQPSAAPKVHQGQPFQALVARKSGAENGKKK